MTIERVEAGTATYVVEMDPKYPLPTNWKTILAEFSARKRPPAVVWDDLIIQPTGRRPIPEAFRLIWPVPEPMFYGQVDHRARCAVRADIYDRLVKKGGAGSVSEALQQVVQTEADQILHCPDLLRFTGNSNKSIYRRIGYAPTPPAKARSISVIINYRDRAELMESCLAALATQRITADLEILCIDNQSKPEERSKVEAIAARFFEGKASVRHLTYDAPFNKSIQDNLGIREARGEVTVMLNNDASPTHPDMLQTISDWAASPGVASAGPRFTGNDGRLVSSGVFIRRATETAPSLIRENELEAFVDTVHFSAGSSFGCAAVAKSAWDMVGPLDTEVFTSQYNDADYYVRAMRAGLRHVYVGTVSCHHEPGRSEPRTKARAMQLLEMFRRRYPDLGEFAGIDPDLVKQKALPIYASPKARLAVLSVRVTRKARSLLRGLRAN